MLPLRAHCNSTLSKIMHVVDCPRVKDAQYAALEAPRQQVQAATPSGVVALCPLPSVRVPVPSQGGMLLFGAAASAILSRRIGGQPWAAIAPQVATIGLFTAELWALTLHG